MQHSQPSEALGDAAALAACGRSRSDSAVDTLRRRRAAPPARRAPAAPPRGQRRAPRRPATAQPCARRLSQAAATEMAPRQPEMLFDRYAEWRAATHGGGLPCASDAALDAALRALVRRCVATGRCVEALLCIDDFGGADDVLLRLRVSLGEQRRLVAAPASAANGGWRTLDVLDARWGPLRFADAEHLLRGRRRRGLGSRLWPALKRAAARRSLALLVGGGDGATPLPLRLAEHLQRAHGLQPSTGVRAGVAAGGESLVAPPLSGARAIEAPRALVWPPLPPPGA